MKPLLAGMVLLLAAASASTQTTTPKYGVKVTVDKATDFGALKTYAWDRGPGWRAPDPAVDAQIVAAVDRQLAALGFRQVTTGAGDVDVVYAALRRTDINLKSKARTPEGLRPSYPVGSLVVMLRTPDTHRELFRARIDTPIDLDPAATASTIEESVARLFAKYPTRKAHDAER